MPVRVKPPPAEIGDTISPTCASLETTMPVNGERTVQLSRSCCATRILSSAACVCSSVREIFARKLSAAVRARSSACVLLTPCFSNACVRRSSRSAFSSCTCRSFRAADVASRSALAEFSRTRASESSSTASTSPSRTCSPSSAIICVTRPVIFAAIVARRRGVT